MSQIVQGDNGTVLKFSIKEDGQIVDLRGASVKVTFKAGNDKYEKDANVTVGENGWCEVVLSSADLVRPGKYDFQATITFSGGKKFSSEIGTFRVDKKL